MKSHLEFPKLDAYVACSVKIIRHKKFFPKIEKVCMITKQRKKEKFHCVDSLSRKVKFQSFLLFFLLYDVFTNRNLNWDAQKPAEKLTCKFISCLNELMKSFLLVGTYQLQTSVRDSYMYAWMKYIFCVGWCNCGITK